MNGMNFDNTFMTNRATFFIIYSSFTHRKSITHIFPNHEKTEFVGIILLPAGGHFRPGLPVAIRKGQ